MADRAGQADDEYGVNVPDGAYRHYRTIGRRRLSFSVSLCVFLCVSKRLCVSVCASLGRPQGRTWHSELCELPQTFEFPTCSDPQGSISKDLRKIVGPGKYALCPGQAWVVPGFETFGAVTCFNEDLCSAAGSDCAGLLGAGSEQVSPCDEHFTSLSLALALSLALSLCL